MDKILLISLGGTIEAEPYQGPPPDRVTPLQEPFIHEALAVAHLQDKVEVIPLCNVDSNNVTEDHLNAVAAIIKARPDRPQVIITHGTDTMIDNAKALQEKLSAMGLSGRKVVMTGAMAPLMNGIQLDGMSNLTGAVNRMEKAPGGVSMFMHGEFFNPRNTWKDKEAKRFRHTNTGPES